MDDPVTAGRKIIVGSVLILVGASLIAFAGALVVIRPRLILITRGLILITRGLVVVREVGAAGRTARSVGYLAAGWTPHNLVTTVLS